MSNWYAVIEDVLYVNEDRPKLAVGSLDGSFVFVDYASEKDGQGGHVLGRWSMLLEMAKNPGETYSYKQWYKTVAGGDYVGVSNQAVQQSKKAMLNELDFALKRSDMGITTNGESPIIFRGNGYVLVGITEDRPICRDFENEQRERSGDCRAEASKRVDEYLKGLSKHDLFKNIQVRASSASLKKVSMDIEQYQHRKVVDSARGTVVNEADLLNFAENVRVHYVVAGAGCGKTVLSYLLVQAALAQRSLSELSERKREEVGAVMSKDEADAVVPFYCSFNPPFGQAVLEIENTTESLVGRIIQNPNSPFPQESTERIELIKSLGSRAVFIVDGLDEASSYDAAQQCLASSMKELDQAHYVIMSRPLTTRPLFVEENGMMREDCETFVLQELESEEEQTSILNRYLCSLEMSSNTGLARQDVDDIVRNHYVKQLLVNPMFAASVAQSCSMKDGRIKADAHKACKGAVDVLLEKAAIALNRTVVGESERDVSFLLKHSFAHLALAFALKETGVFEEGRQTMFKLRSHNELAFMREIAGDASPADGIGIEVFTSIMCSINKHDKLDRCIESDQFWRCAVVPSGIMSYDPSNGGACFFINPTIMRYLAAWYLITLLSRSPKDGMAVIYRLLEKCDLAEAREILVMGVTVAHCESAETGVDDRSVLVQLCIVDEMLKLQGENRSAPVAMLGEIAERCFGDSHPACFEITNEFRPYKNMLRSVVERSRLDAKKALK